MEAMWGMKVYWRNDEMLSVLHQPEPYSGDTRHQLHPPRAARDGDRIASEKCSRGLKEEKMSWRERQEGESGESSGGGRQAPRYESVWREKT